MAQLIIKSIICRCFFIGCLGVSIFLADSVAADENLAEAMTVFKSGQYAKALTLFKKIDGESSTFTSQYNLAVCYYKLGQWKDAKSYFTKLLAEEPENERVLLNLAAVEVKLKEYTAAQSHYLNVAEISASDEVSLFAYKNYKKIEGRNGKGKTQKGALSRSEFAPNISLGYGTDDNILSVVDDTPTTVSDTFTETNASIAWYSSPNFNNNWLIDANIYSSRYSEVSDYDIAVFATGVQKAFSLYKNQRLNVSVRYDQSAIAGEGYLKDLSFSASSRHKYSANSVIKYGLRYRNSTERSSAYKPFAGSALRLFAYHNYAVGGHQWRLTYQYDTEDKNDYLSITDDPDPVETFLSYSPTRHSVIGSWTYTFGDWRTRARMGYRSSEYAGANIYSGADPVQRSDTRLSYSFDVTRSFLKSWSFDVSLDSTHNSSNIESYTYDQTTLTGTLIWQP